MEELIFVEDGPKGKPMTSRNKAARIKRVISHHPDIELPFPPTISIDDILRPKKNIVKSKAPNSFMIYRQVYVRELHQRNLSYAMTDISGIISEKWKHERPHVKDHYTKLSQDANKRHKSIYGIVPVQPRKKIGSKKGKKNSIYSKNETTSTNIINDSSDIILNYINPFDSFIPSPPPQIPVFPYFDNYAFMPDFPPTPPPDAADVNYFEGFFCHDYIQPDQLL
ncbi:hypothetical protein C1645_738352 [Glomus cerebriforme]|uniref:HMG box domain-containing protein n=1 Tax=Glomus cerebriforme TaxID=658196 RepID=A0A397T153_9GLOM|nr:hypothetical protein C1645_738352 [Glomus cerebriforme]